MKNAYFSGASTATTDVDGLADFTGVRFVGRGGDYSLCFQEGTPGDDVPCAALAVKLLWRANYNVDREFNKNFVIISAIHSIAGHKPANEFFDVRFRFRLPAGLSALVGADLNIERASFTEKDTASLQSTRDVTDAFALVNWSGRATKSFWHNAMRVTDARTDALDRLLILGLQARIFSGVPYAGAHIGSVEMGHSKFFGSTFTLGAVRPLSYLPVKLSDDSPVYPVRNNLIAECFLRSSAVDFFKFLNIRATFLMPFETARRVQSRIAVAVPIGGITDF